jgi:hypothetical protein
VIVWLQTADHIRQTSTVQEEQGTTAAFDRARIMRFTVLNKEYAISLIFTHNRLGIFSDLLHSKSFYILSELHPLQLCSFHWPSHHICRHAKQFRHVRLCLASGQQFPHMLYLPQRQDFWPSEGQIHQLVREKV